MQALIDFDGWRRWKDFTNSETTAGTSKLSTSYSRVASRNGTTANGTVTKPKEETEKKAKRKSMGMIPPPVLPEEESAVSTPDVDSGEN